MSKGMKIIFVFLMNGISPGLRACNVCGNAEWVSERSSSIWRTVLQGQESIPQRKDMLENTRQKLEQKILELQENLKYIESKQEYYNDVMAGRVRYTSNLIDV